MYVRKEKFGYTLLPFSNDLCSVLLVGKFQSKLMWYMKLYKKSFTNLKCQELFKAELYTIFICCSHARWPKKNNPSLLMSCLNTFSRQTAYPFYIFINSFRHPCLNYCAISLFIQCLAANSNLATNSTNLCWANSFIFTVC